MVGVKFTTAKTILVFGTCLPIGRRVSLDSLSICLNKRKALSEANAFHAVSRRECGNGE